MVKINLAYHQTNCGAFTPQSIKNEPMFVILREPIKSETFETFAINISQQDAITIEKVDNRFGLTLIKYLDAHFSSQSMIRWNICRMDTYEGCLNLMNVMLDALNTGLSCLDLRQMEMSALQNADIPKV